MSELCVMATKGKRRFLFSTAQDEWVEIENSRLSSLGKAIAGRWSPMQAWEALTLAKRLLLPGYTVTLEEWRDEW